MVNIAKVTLWNQKVGSLARDEQSGNIFFEYDPEFSKKGIEPSPLFVPVKKGVVYNFNELNYNTYRGLPGFIADSLPDTFGNYLINTWLAKQGRDPETYNTIERLLFQGSRAMGALCFEPETSTTLNKSVEIELNTLVDIALQALQFKKTLDTNISDNEKALQTIIRIGTSAGGSRAKAVVAYNKSTGQLLSGQVDAPDDFEHYLLKMDGVTNGNLGDPAYYGCLEYSYYKIALDCGIEMTESFLLPDRKRKHFMTKRFDRVGGKHRVHMVTLCGLAHSDFNTPGAFAYEYLLGVMRQMHLTSAEMEQVFRRMVFNVIGRNQDDHTKNFSFLLDTDNVWKLSPAYDMTYAYKPDGDYTNMHQMSINGKSDNIKREDLLAVAENASIKTSKAQSIISEIEDVFKNIDNYLEPDIPESIVNRVKSNLRVGKL